MDTREKHDLERVIDQYFEEDQKKKSLEKELKNKNAFIKGKLAELGEDIYETNVAKATISYQHRTSMDDEKCIEILKENCKKKDLINVIKTKEYIDYEALESLIYNGGIAAEKLEPAQSETIVTTLKVIAVKKKESKDE